jgi:hypothetical protein
MYSMYVPWLVVEITLSIFNVSFLAQRTTFENGSKKKQRGL